jgi:glycosyltransferase involved in cell wall biosynthesis
MSASASDRRSYRILYHHRIRAEDGQAVHVREMIGALRGLGHEVEECALVPKARSRTAANGAAAAGFWRRLRLPRAGAEALEIAYNWQGRRLIERTAGRFRPHLIYERHALHCRAGLVAARALNAPLLLEVNSPMCDEMERLSALRFPRRARRTERAVLEGADRLLAVSGVLRDRLVALGADPARVRVVRNGAEPARYEHAGEQRGAVRARWGLGPDDFALGFIGYVRAWHGLDLAVAALGRTELQRARLVVVGDGPGVTALAQAAHAAGLGGRVILPGAAAPEQVPACALAFDAAVIPAINDYASPLKLFDYLAAAVPAIVPDQPNLRELVTDGEDALCFAPGNAAALANKVGLLLADPGRAAAIGAAGRRKLLAQDWTWSGAARRVIAAFEELAL